MPEGAAERSGRDQWRGLLEETRLALAALRVDDLEQLAARAERLAGLSGRRVATGQPEVEREHRLLHELLLVTHSNISVFLNKCCNRRGRESGVEGNLRWER